MLLLLFFIFRIWFALLLLFFIFRIWFAMLLLFFIFRIWFAMFCDLHVECHGLLPRVTNVGEYQSSYIQSLSPSPIYSNLKVRMDPKTFLMMLIPSLSLSVPRSHSNLSLSQVVDGSYDISKSLLFFPFTFSLLSLS